MEFHQSTVEAWKTNNDISHRAGYDSTMLNRTTSFS